MTRDSQYPKGVTRYVEFHSGASSRHYFLGISERTGVHFFMRYKTQIYVVSVTIVAGLWAALSYRVAPGVRPGMLTDALLLCSLAVTAEFLSYVLPKAATGS